MAAKSQKNSKKPALLVLLVIVCLGVASFASSTLVAVGAILAACGLCFCFWPSPPGKSHDEHQKPERWRSGYSAYGEDIVVTSWFQHFGIDLTTLRYLDIGAAHPWKISNTYLLYEYGARGVLVEPDPDQARVLAASRPNDTVLNVGVTFDDRRSASLNRLTVSFFNTFSAEQADFVVKSSESWNPDQKQEIVDTIEVPMIQINEIIEQHFAGMAPDFISIDAESNDIDIIRTLDLTRFKPWIICMEAVADRAQTDVIFLPHGYVFMANTPDNFMYMIDSSDPSWKKPRHIH